jgi:hypothetical protein
VKEEKVPKGYTKKDPRIPTFETERVITLGTEPFKDFEKAEEFRRVLKMSRDSGEAKPKPKRKRVKRQMPPLFNPVGSPNGMMGYPEDQDTEPSSEPDDLEDAGLFGDNPDSFF